MVRMALTTPLLLYAALFFLAAAAAQEQEATPPLPSASSTFCSRVPQRKKCPSPPTFDILQLPPLSGKWFEVGATAVSRLAAETGDICTGVQVGGDTDNASVTGNVSVAATSLHVAGPLATLAVQQVAASVGTACAGARAVCDHVAPAGSAVADAVAALTEVAAAVAAEPAARLRDVAALVNAGMRETADAVDRFAATMEAIQRLDAELAARCATSNATVESIGALAGQASLQLDEAKRAVSKLSDASSDVIKVSSDVLLAGDFANSVRLSQASTEIAANSNAVLVQITEMRLAMEGVRAGKALVNLGGGSSERRLNSASGYALQNGTSAGKFLLHLSASPEAAPLWVLSMRGRASIGYRAALLYSCQQLTPDSIKQQLIVLSRAPHLHPNLLQQLLEVASSLGINTDCDDPFLFVTQSRNSCARAWTNKP